LLLTFSLCEMHTRTTNVLYVSNIRGRTEATAVQKQGAEGVICA